MVSFDRVVLEAVGDNIPAGVSPALVAFFADVLPFAALGAAVFLLFLKTGSSGARDFFAPVAVSFASAILARFVVTEAIRLWWDRPRPFEVMDFTPLLAHDPGASFPSGHAAFFFAAAAALWPFSRLASATFFAASTLMGFARIAGGIHWPSDIIGGAIIGVCSAWVVYKVYVCCYRNRRKTV